MKHKLASWWKTIKLTANLMAGVPDYENYVARQRKHNPNAPVMTELPVSYTHLRAHET
ncbi:MAG: CstA-like transporter-associated (seleno)protein, partial [Neisseria sp.]|nr:CstA-like transporter-associated (seleno)protein [Neisseria sp.]